MPSTDSDERRAGRAAGLGGAGGSEASGEAGIALAAEEEAAACAAEAGGTRYAALGAGRARALCQRFLAAARGHSQQLSPQLLRRMMGPKVRPCPAPPARAARPRRRSARAGSGGP